MVDYDDQKPSGYNRIFAISQKKIIKRKIIFFFVCVVTLASKSFKNFWLWEFIMNNILFYIKQSYYFVKPFHSKVFLSCEFVKKKKLAKKIYIQLSKILEVSPPLKKLTAMKQFPPHAKSERFSRN